MLWWSCVKRWKTASVLYIWKLYHVLLKTEALYFWFLPFFYGLWGLQSCLHITVPQQDHPLLPCSGHPQHSGSMVLHTHALLTHTYSSMKSWRLLVCCLVIMELLSGLGHVVHPLTTNTWCEVQRKLLLVTATVSLFRLRNVGGLKQMPPEGSSLCITLNSQKGYETHELVLKVHFWIKWRPWIVWSQNLHYVPKSLRYGIGLAGSYRRHAISTNRTCLEYPGSSCDQ